MTHYKLVRQLWRVTAEVEVLLLRISGAKKSFDPNWYKIVYQDIDTSIKNPIRHYVHYGKIEGRWPSPLICPSWIRRQQGIIGKVLNINPLWMAHFLKWCVSPHPLVSARLLRKNNKSFTMIQDAGHKTKEGIIMNKGISNLFDQKWYRETYDCVLNGEKVSAIYHYLAHGCRDGFDPSPMISIGYMDCLTKPNNKTKGLDPVSAYVFSKAENRVLNSKDYFIIHRLEGALLRCSELYKESATCRDFAKNYEIIDLERNALAPMKYMPFTYKEDEREKELMNSIQRENNIFHSKKDEYPQSTPNTHIQTKANYYYVTLNNAFKVIGYSTVVTEQGTCYDNELYDCAREGDIDLKGVLKYSNDKAIIKFREDKSSNFLPEGIDLTGYADCNYFHFMSDILPKVFLSASLKIDKELPFIVNRDLPRQFLDMIRMIDDFNRSFVKLENECGYKFGKLACISKTYRLANMYKRKATNLEPILPIDLLQKIRTKVYTNLRISGTPPRKHKVYLKRKGSRNIANLAELELLLFNNNFIFISPENYSAEMQIRLFSRTSHMLSPTGASLTNIIWAAPNTEVLVLMADNPLHQGTIWEDLGTVSKSNVRLQFGARTYTTDSHGGVHDDFVCDLEKVEKWIVSTENK